MATATAGADAVDGAGAESVVSRIDGSTDGRLRVPRHALPSLLRGPSHPHLPHSGLHAETPSAHTQLPESAEELGVCRGEEDNGHVVSSMTWDWPPPAATNGPAPVPDRFGEDDGRRRGENPVRGTAGARACHVMRPLAVLRLWTPPASRTAEGCTPSLAGEG